MSSSEYSFTCTTFDISKKAKHRPHGPMHARQLTWSHARKKMREYKITIEDIKIYTGLPLGTISRALDLHQFLTSHYINIGRVRLAVELLLHREGYSADNDDSVVTLWDDYEDNFSRAL